MLYVVLIPVAMIMVFSDLGIYLREAVMFCSAVSPNLVLGFPSMLCMYAKPRGVKFCIMKLCGAQHTDPVSRSQESFKQ